MSELKKCIANQVEINETDLANIADEFRERNLSKGEFFLEADMICRELAFIESGYLRILT